MKFESETNDQIDYFSPTSVSKNINGPIRSIVIKPPTKPLAVALAGAD